MYPQMLARRHQLKVNWIAASLVSAYVLPMMEMHPFRDFFNPQLPRCPVRADISTASPELSIARIFCYSTRPFPAALVSDPRFAHQSSKSGLVVGSFHTYQASNICAQFT
jgi:hypothetical protein